MDTLTATLEAAQQEPSSRPYVYALLEDCDGFADRFHFTRVYTGAEASDHAAVVVAPDGSLVRARRDGSTVYTSRITAPGASSTFSSWTSLGAISSTGAGLALCSDGTDLYLFYVHTTNTGIRVRVSTDNGASWGSATSIATATGAVSYLAAAANPFSGDVVVFWTVGPFLYSSRFTGSWAAAVQWDKTGDMTSLSGIAAAWNFDFQVVWTGLSDPATDAGVWTAVFGDDNDLAADNWGAMVEVELAAAGTTVTYHSPSLAVQGSVYRLTYLEKYTSSVASRRLQLSWQLASEPLSSPRWREPWPLEYLPSVDYGLAMAYGPAAGQLWLAASSGVWLATRKSVADLDLTADIVGAAVDIGESGGRARLELDNADGHLTGHASIRLGMRLTLTPGYAGELPQTARHYWVEAVEQVTGPRPRIVLHARNAWWLLERWTSRRQYTWPAGDYAIFEAFAVVLARAGLSATNNLSSSLLMGWEPFLTISPGENGSTVIRRLLANLADCMRFLDTQGVLQEPLAADDPVYAYGVGHAIVEGRYVETGKDINRARVLGLGDYVEELDYDDLDLAGQRPSAPVVDLNLTNNSLASSRAFAVLRRSEIRSRSDEVRIFGVNCGQELYDVVEVTDPGAGLSGALRRVLGLSWVYETQPRRRYEMTLTLGVV